MKNLTAAGFVTSLGSFLLSSLHVLEQELRIFSLLIGIVLGLLGIVGWFWKHKALFQAKKTQNENTND